MEDENILVPTVNSDEEEIAELSLRPKTLN